MPEHNITTNDTTTIPGERRVDVIDDLVKISAGAEALFIPRVEIADLATNLMGLAMAQIGTEIADEDGAVDETEAAVVAKVMHERVVECIVEWRGVLGLPTTD